MAPSSTLTASAMPEAVSVPTPKKGTVQIDPRGKSVYQPQLDGLRALAILGILAEHFGLALPAMLRCGPLSVRFFFVLTGYFITLSLWRVKAEMAESRESSHRPLGRYYLARLLRIGPPFYFALFAGAALGIAEVRTNFLWLATFQANNYIAYLGYWPDSISHFWSLAVQEQFYMLWPLVVLALPRRWFLPLMISFILFGLGFRIVCIMLTPATLLRWVTLFGCLDSFAVGGLIAYLMQAKVLQKLWQSQTMLIAMPLIAFACFFLGRALMTLPEGNLWLALTESVDAIFLAWVLTASLIGIKGRYANILSWSPLVYLGKISYGVYVYHVFVIVVVSPLLEPYGYSEAHGNLVRLMILFTLTLAISSLSWHYLEQPFLAWKKSLSPKRRPALEPVPVTSSQTTFA
ncbi:MAG: acyltransferase [Methylacidiphilales bacterium]|nr:acyltransferase [Candidatus Methylacidiphilales bacterium]